MVLFIMLIGLGIWLVAIGLMVLGTCRAWVHFRSKTANRPVTARPISVLKPVKGLEAGLRENLESFFRLQYPEFEIIISIAEANDPSRPTIEAMIDQYQHVQARLIIGDIKRGANPKVNNLIKGYESAKYDWILISDSNVRVNSDYLFRASEEFTDDVGVVTAVVCGYDVSAMHTFGGALEAVFLNTFYARWMFIAEYFKQECVVGKSMLFRKSTAERFGGIAQLGRFLAEDYMAGRAMRMLGLKVIMMRQPITQPLAHYHVIDFWRRHIRWGRIRKAQAPLPVFFEPWTGFLPSALIGATAGSWFLGIEYWKFFIAHVLFWLANDMILMQALRAKWSISLLPAWVSRELIAVPLWIQMMSGDTVFWRGARLRVKQGGILEEAKS